MGGIKVKLITGRTIEQGTNLENKLSEEYFNAVAVCELSEGDMKRLGISEGEEARVKVKTDYGEVVVKAKKGDGNPDGIVFIPMGPWANAVIGGDTHGVGMPQYKGVDAEVEKTDEKVLSIKELMQKYIGGE
ncbi:MAG: molybdopterin dinucleotide binding domain-containing protein [Candidatus Methanospirareceae archaeon]